MIKGFYSVLLFAAIAGSITAQTKAPETPLELLPIEGAHVLFEAEDFVLQSKTGTREWHIVSKKYTPDVTPDPDPPHLDGADAYIEALPDTRTNHDDKLIRGENFAPEPGKMAVLHYRVKFPKAGKYYVWARAYSTGTEDNGFHIGLNGEWPESGQRWQTVEKNAWHWECKQRTDKVHTGVRMQLFLDIPSAGEHDIAISMREDGAELDKILMVMDKSYRPPGVEESPNAEPKKAKPPVKITRQADGNGEIEVSGELKTWHKVTLTIDGPWAHEMETTPNPFTDCDLQVRFTHESGESGFTVPGYFAADGNSSETSAESGTKWRVHFAPHAAGNWNYEISFLKAKDLAISGGADKTAPLPGHGKTGSFQIVASDKVAPDFRARGRLSYVGERYLQFEGDHSYFLKAGPDAPETFLAYVDFDGTRANNPKKGPLKLWAPHVPDWKAGDPLWQKTKGKGMIGALNYLSEKGLNTFSFLTYNAGGDGDNVWPFVERDEKFHYDCSKLDQWGIVFDHGTSLGLHLHFKLQETEMDDNRRGHKEQTNSEVPTSLDGGKLGRERKLYLKELIARFGHNLALNWNIGEENTQSTEEIIAMADFIHEIDPYDHNIVIHTFPNQQDKVYPPLLGEASALTGASLQNGWNQVHERTLKWVLESEIAGKKWVVANDEQGPANLGVPPDPGYKGFSGKAGEKGKEYTLLDIRRDTLWGNLMAGGAGVEYYFGYKIPESDLICEDFRSRDRSWDFCREALEFFHNNGIPFWKLSSADRLVGNPKGENKKPWCLGNPDHGYLIFFPQGTSAVTLDLTDVKGQFLRMASLTGEPAATAITGGSLVEIQNPAEDNNVPLENAIWFLKQPEVK